MTQERIIFVHYVIGTVQWHWYSVIRNWKHCIVIQRVWQLLLYMWPILRSWERMRTRHTYTRCRAMARHGWAMLTGHDVLWFLRSSSYEQGNRKSMPPKPASFTSSSVLVNTDNQSNTTIGSIHDSLLLSGNLRGGWHWNSFTLLKAGWLQQKALCRLVQPALGRLGRLLLQPVLCFLWLKSSIVWCLLSC